MKLKFSDMLAILIGFTAVAGGIALVWLLGVWVEPHVQWLPAVADLQLHAWYSSAMPASTGFGRSFYVGLLVLIAVALVGIVACVAGGIAFELRQLGQIFVRQFMPRERL